ERVEPRPDLLQRQRRHLRDVAPLHADVQRLRADSGPATRAARGRALVLPEKYADVLLVLLPLAGDEEREHALAALRLPGALQPVLSEVLRQRTPRGAERQAPLLRERVQPLPLLAVARLRPGIDGALLDRTSRVGHDQRRVVLERGAEAGADRAGPVGVVEREQL